jgi:hypothetical protein
MKKITVKKHSTTQVGLTLAEVGLFTHILRTRRRDGNFQQHYTDIAQATFSTPPTVHRHLQALIAKNAVEIIVPSKRGPDGYPIPPVLRPIPKMEQAYSTDGIGVASNANPAKVSEKMEQAQVVERTSDHPIPKGGKPIPNGTLILNSICNSSDVDCLCIAASQDNIGVEKSKCLDDSLEQQLERIHAARRERFKKGTR